MNFIRPVDGLSGEELNCIHHGNPKIFNCWVIEFSFKVDTSTKLINGMTFDQTMAEGNDFRCEIIFATSQLK